MIAVRAAAAETDRMIAARAVAPDVSSNPQSPANTPATLDERRSGLDRRDAGATTPSNIDDRRSGLERRSITVKAAPAAEFGRRGPRTN